jgi:hypothetical protein
MAQTETSRMRALKSLANQLPVANQRIAQQQKAAQDIQVQQAVRKAPTQAITSTAQDTGAAVAQQAGEQQVSRAQNLVQQQQKVGQLGIGEQSLATEQKVSDQQSGAKESAMGNVQRLAALDESAKRQIYDRQMQFERDENGRTLFNERQLADYARSKAQSDEEYKNYAQKAQQLSDRKLQAMETAYQKVQQDLEFKYQQAKQSGDQENILKIEKKKEDVRKEMQQIRTDTANNKAMWVAGGTIVGAVVGAVVTSESGGWGAVPGAAAGGALGAGASTF